MHEIVLIEEFYVRKDGDLEITAIVENMGHQTVYQSLYDLPEFAPARCYATISKEYLPEGVEFKGKNQDELEELVNRHGLLFQQEWKVITLHDDRDVDDYEPTGSRLFF